MWGSEFMLSCLCCGAAGFKFNDQPFYQKLFWSLLFTKGALWGHVGGGSEGDGDAFSLSSIQARTCCPHWTARSPVKAGLARFRVTRQVFLKLHFAWKLAKLASSAQSICDLCSWIILQHCQSLLWMMSLQISLIFRSLDLNTSLSSSVLLECRRR